VFQSRLHHVGIIVADAEQVDLLAALLGLVRGADEYVAEYEAQCYFTGAPGGAGAAIEFIVPRPGSKLTKFNKGFGGLHHIALEVDDLADASAALRERGVKLLEDHPVDAGSLLINFVPPLYTRGFIVEFIQVKTREVVRTELQEGSHVGPAL
jgi:catechol 2,3-dioxygenase-like lactoylglutathione lyase family enzyme